MVTGWKPGWNLTRATLLSKLSQISSSPSPRLRYSSATISTLPSMYLARGSAFTDWKA